jgi:hypothetical protein
MKIVVFPFSRSVSEGRRWGEAPDEGIPSPLPLSPREKRSGRGDHFNEVALVYNTVLSFN